MEENIKSMFCKALNKAEKTKSGTTILIQGSLTVGKTRSSWEFKLIVVDEN